jgi:branched-chain amino acid aminotransferase
VGFVASVSGAKVSLFDVYGADEDFVTGTFGGLTPVVKIDGRVIGDGKPGTVTNMLYHKFLELERSATHLVSR